MSPPKLNARTFYFDKPPQGGGGHYSYFTFADITANVITFVVISATVIFIISADDIIVKRILQKLYIIFQIFIVHIKQKQERQAVPVFVLII